MELGKEIGWINPKKSDEGEYDDTNLKNQLRTLNNKINELEENIDNIGYDDTDLKNQIQNLEKEINELEENIDNIGKNDESVSFEDTNLPSVEIDIGGINNE